VINLLSMARPLRIVHPRAWYHITARGNERRDIFIDDPDRRHFLELLAETAERFGVTFHAYVLMNNHYHLLLQLSRPNLSRALQWLNVSYSAWFNRRHRRCGHLFQGRFKSILVEPASWGLSLSAYIHLNPVRVARLGLAKTDRRSARAAGHPAPDPQRVQKRLSSLCAFRWSSYPAYLGVAARPVWLDCDSVLALGGGKASEAARKYRDYVEKQIREGLPERPWDQLTNQIILGAARFLKEAKKLARQTVAQRARKPRWSRGERTLAEVISAVEQARQEKWTDFKNRHGHSGRDQVLYLARKTTALSLSELAEEVEMKTDATISMAVKRYATKLKQNRSERDFVARAAEMLNVGI
jgi:REP element-mobilizing transposase RayT